jgi:hypothetical protein
VLSIQGMGLVESSTAADAKKASCKAFGSQACAYQLGSTSVSYQLLTVPTALVVWQRPQLSNLSCKLPGLHLSIKQQFSAPRVTGPAVGRLQLHCCSCFREDSWQLYEGAQLLFIDRRVIRHYNRCEHDVGQRTASVGRACLPFEGHYVDHDSSLVAMRKPVRIAS